MDLPTQRNGCNVMELFENKEMVKICAPMVRYSKLQFRNLVRKYDCDVCYTPMILADSFCQSSKARNNEFTTNLYDSPLITQFAANTVHDFVGAANLVAPFCDGVDLNCGCPQRWAKQQGLGCILLENPELIYDMTRQCRNQINKSLTVSVKMRLHKNVRRSVEICRQLEKCHVSFITVHARTGTQLTGEIDEEGLKLITGTCKIPVVANGGVKNFKQAVELLQRTSCRGVMVANALLSNPTLFRDNQPDFTHTMLECAQNWVDICYNSTLSAEKFCKMSSKLGDLLLDIQENPFNLTFQCFHHHLVFMLEKILPKDRKRIFNNFQTFKQVLSFLKSEFNITPRLFNIDEFVNAQTMTLDYGDRGALYHNLKPSFVVENDDNEFDNNACKGKYFESKLIEEEDCDWSNLFLENG